MTNHPFRDAIVTGLDKPEGDVALPIERYTIFFAETLADVRERDLSRTLAVALLASSGYAIFTYDSTASVADDGVDGVWDANGRVFKRRLGLAGIDISSIVGHGDLAGRDAYDAEDAGSVYWANEEYRSPFYINEDGAGTWSDPIYFTGEPGVSASDAILNAIAFA